MRGKDGQSRREGSKIIRKSRIKLRTEKSSPRRLMGWNQFKWEFGTRDIGIKQLEVVRC